MASLIRQQHVDAVLNIVSALREVEELHFTVSQAVKGSLMVAGCAFLGGLLGGKTGLALGGGLGALAVGIGQSDYKSAVEIIRNDLSVAQKEHLYDQLRRSISAFGTSDLGALQKLLTNTAVRGAVAAAVIKFLTQEGYSILTQA